MLSVINLNVVMLKDIVLSVVILNVVILNVAALVPWAERQHREFLLFVEGVPKEPRQLGKYSYVAITAIFAWQQLCKCSQLKKP
jgi:hypothetical protein